jgi:formylglycine-generating enzyme
VGTSGYRWNDEGGEHELSFAPVAGTDGTPYMFGRTEKIAVEINDFHIATTPVTISLWTHVRGSNPATKSDLRCPVENVSWNHITEPGGFLERINAGPILPAIAGPGSTKRFRLPSETEWEYAARGGQHWTDGFTFSGSNDPDEVAWYGRKWSGGALKWQLSKTEIGKMLFGTNAITRAEPHTHEVATKRANQLGIYDMCGNVWEWCQDVCTDDLELVPKDGTPYLGPGDERRLRGGCFNNWDFLCSVSWRYGIEPGAHDGCIGVRIVLAEA